MTIGVRTGQLSRGATLPELPLEHEAGTGYVTTFRIADVLARLRALQGDGRPAPPGDTPSGPEAEPHPGHCAGRASARHTARRGTG